MEYIDPDIEKLLAEADPDEPDFWELTPELARAKCDTMIDDMLPPVHVRQVRDLLIPLDGDESLAARAYLPSDGGPLLVFFHGGGWEVGTIELCDRPLRRLANDSG